jgi:predicted nuclease of predicted toxin-antitoxin system
VKFKLDENLPVELAEVIVSAGHDADTVFSEGLTGAADQAVVDAASHTERILLTLDKGIANILQYPVRTHAGIVLFRPASTGRGAVQAFVKERMHEILQMNLGGRITVVGPRGIRFR